MILDFENIIKRLKALEKEFNETQDATQRYAIIQAINHIGEVEIPIHFHWENSYRKAMLRDKGIKI